MNTYRAGQLNQRINIERTRLQRDELGGYKTLTQPTLRLWAYVRRTSAKEELKNQALGQSISAVFVVRNRNDIADGDCIIYRNQRYKITGDPTFDPRDAFLELNGELIYQ